MLSGCKREASTATLPDKAASTTDQSDGRPDPVDKPAALTSPAPLSPPETEPADPVTPPQTLAEIHQAGLEALQSGESDRAFELARQAMRMDDTDPQVIFLMALVLGDRQRFPEAIEMLDGVAKSTPEARLPALGQTADWLVRHGDWDEAESRYREVLAQVPQSALVHRNLARLLLRQGRRMEAKTHLEQLCLMGNMTESELNAMLTLAYPVLGDEEEEYLEPIGELGQSRIDIARGEWDSVRTRLEDQNTKRGPWDSSLLGRAYAVLGENEQLGRWVANATEAVDQSPDAWFARGIHLAIDGKHAAATRCFVENIRKDSTDRDAYAHLATSLAAIGMAEKSAVAKRRAELLEQTYQLGIEIANAEDHAPPSILKLSDRLRELERPLEALGWRGVWLSYTSDTDSQRIMNEIIKERQTILAEGRALAPESFVVCGIDLDALPSLEEIAPLIRSQSEP